MGSAAGACFPLYDSDAMDIYVAAALKPGFACSTGGTDSAAAARHGAVAGTAADTLATGAISFRESCQTLVQVHTPRMLLLLASPLLLVPQAWHLLPAAAASFSTAPRPSSLVPPVSCLTASETSALRGFCVMCMPAETSCWYFPKRMRQCHVNRLQLRFVVCSVQDGGSEKSKNKGKWWKRCLAGGALAGAGLLLVASWRQYEQKHPPSPG